MPRAAPKGSAPVVLVCGEDEFAVKERAKELYSQWTSELGGLDHEIIDASVSNSGEALRALKRLRESLQTLPFFGSAKAVWLKDCNFLGDERAASAQSVTEALAELAQDLKDFSFENVRLLISAGKVDKRKILFKALDKLGTVEALAGWSIDDRDWAAQGEDRARTALRARGKNASQTALSELIARIGPNARLLDSEVEKLSLFVGDRTEITADDVAAISTRNRTARAFAVGEALGDRDLSRLLQRLDEELWEVKLDPKKSEIGLLYGLISKVRSLIFLKEMAQEGWVKPTTDYSRFKGQLERIPAESLPRDKRFNPLAANPYVLFKALPQAGRYRQEELVRAMDLLLECNRRLVSSSVDAALVLQQTMVQIVGTPEPAAARAGSLPGLR